MKHLSWYKDKVKMRAYRNRQRKINYDRGNFITRPGKRYQPYEDWEVLFSTETDRKVARELNRSVRSIQLRRWKILSG